MILRLALPIGLYLWEGHLSVVHQHFSSTTLVTPALIAGHRPREIPSLFDICMQTCRQYCASLGDVGDIPAEFLVSILEHAPPDTLLRVAQLNPHRSDLALDKLMRRHCVAEFGLGHLDEDALDDLVQREADGSWLFFYTQRRAAEQARLEAAAARLRASRGRGDTDEAGSGAKRTRTCTLARIDADTPGARRALGLGAPRAVSKETLRARGVLAGRLPSLASGSKGVSPRRANGV